MVNVSRNSAQIRSCVDATIAIGSLVDINIGGRRGIVEVRRIEISHDPSVAYYGVQFFDLEAALKDLVQVLTGRMPSSRFPSRTSL